MKLYIYRKRDEELTWKKSFLNDDRVPRIFFHSFPNVSFVTWIQVKVSKQHNQRH